ncbi:hypothetical protein [uncultured Methanomethylovorans sp.]|uniref:hypothetical protein n=1 Tax=uncultured Methanomethylovorans sp. TaxID=183759 RepID=UPI002AA7BEA5|nr:hypothetical protein [uncultured Methanomethylovorans sp.]
MVDADLHDKELTQWARETKEKYGPQLDYFLKSGSHIEQKLAQRVIELAGEATA